MSSLDLLEAPARQRASLESTAHRPWPVPETSWTIGQSWDDLLFMHWRVDREALRRLVPDGVEVQEHDGSAWLGVTPFRISGFRLRGTFPLPLVSSFPELNVRTYVTAEDKPGIWFFSLDTPSVLAVEGARRAYRLPYFLAEAALRPGPGGIEFRSRRRNAERPFTLETAYRSDAEPFEPQPGTLEHFLSERYCLYAARGARLCRADIHHTPWLLREAEAEIRTNTMPPDGISLPGDAPLCYLAERQDVVIWPLEPV